MTFEAYDREEHERQRAAALALRARIESDAAKQRQAKQIVAAEQQFSDDADLLARLDGELRAGKPIENMATGDIKFLIGSEDKKRLWNTFGSTRRARWQKAFEAMPRPPADASEHVTKTYVGLLEKVHARKRETVRTVPKQAGLWYRELCRREVAKTLLNHIPPCSRHCTTDEWAFVLDLPSFMPRGEPFDPAGNFKPTRTKPEPDEEAGTNAEASPE